ncbi:MAG: thioredoxin domain-containing protein [Christensenellales bacterium]|jgi:uncharacterized protein YyaL (SSP411 family)
MSNAAKSSNRLIREKSPYLLQHIHNPVDWWPWCDEAFDKAKAENKPVLLSIGYSTCHWCHVMARESFEDNEVAALLNRHFISIKVDKEERADIDSVYMTVCQMMTGQGGWPLTILMTPQAQPFFAGTYFPKNDRYQTPGLLSILSTVAELWEKEPERLHSTSNKISAALKEAAAAKGQQTQQPNQAIFARAAQDFSRNFSEPWGGFGHAPKFPTPHHLFFLLRHAYFNQDHPAKTMVQTTLNHMASGGIYDQIGGGFCRYSTDERWLAPHFEKMLYDNALLSIAYLEAYQFTDNPAYKRITQQTLAYVQRSLTSPQGAFYCAQDADSEGQEGAFYVFTPKEIKSLLGEEDGQHFCAFYDITEAGNFEGKNIPNRIGKGLHTEEDPSIAALLPQLLAYRDQRMPLHTDDKILLPWNAMMIVAYAKAGKALHTPAYLDSAKTACAFLLENLRTDEGRLLNRWREGEARFPAYLDGYAYFIWALLELYDATYDASYLKEAIQHAHAMIRLFHDPSSGAFLLYGNDAPSLIANPVELYDNAYPCGNSVAAYVLHRLYRLSTEPAFLHYADSVAQAQYGAIHEHPMAASFGLVALMSALLPGRELICTSETSAGREQLRNKLWPAFRPDINTILLEEGQEEIRQLLPHLKDYPLKPGPPLFYLCTNGRCAAPVSTLNGL